MKLKICGLKTLRDVECVNEIGADYAGFVFTPHRQQISVDTARALKAALRPDILSVGVFIGESYDFIRSIAYENIIDLVQFHGEAEYPMPCQTIKAFRVRTSADIQKTQCDFALFDSFSSDEAGSSGKAFDWRLIEGYTDKPFFIAGGINASNIKQAMELKPYCIDISSGVEENGEKSIELLREIKEIMNAYS